MKKDIIKIQSFRINFANTYCYSLPVVLLISCTLLFSNAYGFILAGANSNLILQIPTSSSNFTSGQMVMDHSQMDHMNMNMNMNMNQTEMLKRGDIAMKFNQSKISHQFVITPNGGQIKISALDNNDNQTVSQIKDHIRNIQKEFSEGNFNRSSFIHATTVPGTEVMTDKRNLIDYSIIEMNNGSSLILESNDTEVIDAISQFMEFQAIEHKGH
jgi:hypothetical protein